MDYWRDFRYVNIEEQSSAEELYLVSSGKVPSTVVIILNGLSTNKMNAYKSKITDEILQECCRHESNKKLSESMYMKEVENALTGVKDFGFELIYKYRKAQKLVLFNSVDIKNPKTILEAEVDEISPSEGAMCLAKVGQNLSRISLDRLDVQPDPTDSLAEENSRLKKMQNDLRVEVNKWQDQTLRVCTKLLNEKKRRITELEGQLNGTKPSTGGKSKRRKAKVSSSEEEEKEISDGMNVSDENTNSSDAYKRDTEVDEPFRSHDFDSDENESEAERSKEIMSYFQGSTRLKSDEADDTGSETDFKEDSFRISPKEQENNAGPSHLGYHDLPKDDSRDECQDGVPVSSPEETKGGKHSKSNPSSDTGDEFDDTTERLLEEFLANN